MNQHNNGGPAFPTKKHPVSYGIEPGMSLRDYFAANAMQGLAANPEAWDMTDEKVAELAYNTADAMLRTRDVTEKPCC